MPRNYPTRIVPDPPPHPDPGPRWSAEELANLGDHLPPTTLDHLLHMPEREASLGKQIREQEQVILRLNKQVAKMMSLVEQMPGEPPTSPTPTPTPTTVPASSSKRGSVSRWSGTRVCLWTWITFCATYLGYSVYAALHHPWDPNAPGYESYWNVPWVVGGPIAAMALVFSLGWALQPDSKTARAERRKKPMVNLGPLSEETPPEPDKNYLNDHFEGLFPPHVFEPYSVCPKCGREGLHWMRAPYEDEGTGENTKTNPYWREDLKNPKRLSSFGVIRTCRNEACGVSWGQSTMTSSPDWDKPVDKPMSTEAVLVPRPVTEEEVLQDKADTLAEIQEERPPRDFHEDPTSGWSKMSDVLAAPRDTAVPAPVQASRIDPVEQWADAFMDGVAPERTYEEHVALKATAFNPHDIAGSVANAIDNMRAVEDALREANQTTEAPAANTPMPKPTGGALSTADAQAKTGKDAVKDYRAKGGKMHVVGPGGLVMANKDPETGVWAVPNKRTKWVGTERDTGAALPPSHTRAIDAEIIDAKEVPLPEDEK